MKIHSFNVGRMKAPTKKEVDEALRYGKCEHCQKGDFGKCNQRNKPTHIYVEDNKGKRKYYCNMGCIMLQMNEKQRKELFHGIVVGGMIQ